MMTIEKKWQDITYYSTSLLRELLRELLDKEEIELAKLVVGMIEEIIIIKNKEIERQLEIIKEIDDE